MRNIGKFLCAAVFSLYAAKALSQSCAFNLSNLPPDLQTYARELLNAKKNGQVVSTYSFSPKETSLYGQVTSVSQSRDNRILFFSIGTRSAYVERNHPLTIEVLGDSRALQDPAILKEKWPIADQIARLIASQAEGKIIHVIDYNSRRTEEFSGRVSKLSLDDRGDLSFDIGGKRRYIHKRTAQFVHVL